MKTRRNLVAAEERGYHSKEPRHHARQFQCWRSFSVLDTFSWNHWILVLLLRHFLLSFFAYFSSSTPLCHPLNSPECLLGHVSLVILHTWIISFTPTASASSRQLASNLRVPDTRPHCMRLSTWTDLWPFRMSQSSAVSIIFHASSSFLQLHLCQSLQSRLMEPRFTCHPNKNPRVTGLLCSSHLEPFRR